MSSDFELVSWWMTGRVPCVLLLQKVKVVPIQQCSASSVTAILKIQARLKVCDILPYWAINFENDMKAFCLVSLLTITIWRETPWDSNFIIMKVYSQKSVPKNISAGSVIIFFYVLKECWKRICEFFKIWCLLKMEKSLLWVS